MLHERHILQKLEVVEKDLGEMALAIAEEDREIDRLAEPPCDDGKKPRVGPGPAATNGPAALIMNRQYRYAATRGATQGGEGQLRKDRSILQ